MQVTMFSSNNTCIKFRLTFIIKFNISTWLTVTTQLGVSKPQSKPATKSKESIGAESFFQVKELFSWVRNKLACWSLSGAWIIKYTWHNFNFKGVEYFPCTLRIQFSTRGAYLLMVPLGRAFIRDRVIIYFSRNRRKC